MRGLAVKILDVRGARVGGGDQGAQDLLFNNSRTSEVSYYYIPCCGFWSWTAPPVGGWGS